MRTNIKLTVLAGAVGAAMALLAPAAHATAFGPAGFTYSDLSSFPGAAVTGSTIAFSSTLLHVSTGSQTGMFAGLNGSNTTVGANPSNQDINANGTLNYGAVGVTVPDAISSFLTITASDSSTYTFDLTSVEAFLDSINGQSVQISLYLLGTMGGSGQNFTATPTSMTLQLSSSNGGSSFGLSGSLANPPATNPLLPEPGSLALLGTALAGLSLLRRRR